MRDRGADGVNLDFEPIASGYSDEFTSLVRAVRSQLARVHKGYQLTFDTTGWIGNYPIQDATARGAADAVVIMGYDYRTAGSSPVGSLAPIGGPAYDLGDTIAAFLARVPASKVILGVPYYGRAWSTATASLHAKNISGTKYGASVPIPYATAREFARAYGHKYDPVEGVSWLAYRRQNCTTAYGCVTAVAPAVLRRRHGAQGEVRPRQPRRPARRRHLGARLRRDATRAIRRAQGQVHHRQGPARHHGRQAQRHVVLARTATAARTR